MQVRHKDIVNGRRLEAEAEHLAERAVCGVDHCERMRRSQVSSPSLDNWPAPARLTARPAVLGERQRRAVAVPARPAARARPQKEHLGSALTTSVRRPAGQRLH